MEDFTPAKYLVITHGDEDHPNQESRIECEGSVENAKETAETVMREILGDDDECSNVAVYELVGCIRQMKVKPPVERSGKIWANKKK